MKKILKILGYIILTLLNCVMAVSLICAGYEEFTYCSCDIDWFYITFVIVLFVMFNTYTVLNIKSIIKTIKELIYNG